MECDAFVSTLPKVANDVDWEIRAKCLDILAALATGPEPWGHVFEALEGDRVLRAFSEEEPPVCLVGL